jgi:hypothetical protein
MTINPQDGQKQDQISTENGQKQDKEHNFALLRGQLEKERLEKQSLLEELEKTKKLASERINQKEDLEEVEDDNEPYVDHRKLEKKLAKFGAKTKQETDERIQSAVQRALSEERKNMWLKSNPDFYEVMQHAQTFADKDPELAETILQMPEGFERQKLVYKNIKALGIHKKEEPKTNIQNTIDQNRKSPFYQPSGIASAPYANVGDFSPTGQKTSYEKMKEMQKRLRI